MNQQSSIEQIKEELLEEYYDDFKTYAKDCEIIRDHNTSELLPFIFNEGQEILHAVTEKQKAEKGYVRINLLKTRRFGGSTYIEGRFYWRASLNFNKNAFIVGHEEDSTATLYAMARLFHEKNPDPPATRKSNAQELIFDNEKGTGLKSQYRLATARNIHAGKSQGIHYLHASEEAMYYQGATLLGGLLQCVPDPPAESEVFRESTANGYGNSFQEDVFKSYGEGKFPYYEKDGIIYAWHNPDETDYILVFIPWFVHSWYNRKFDSQTKKQEFIDRLNTKVFNKEDLKWEDSEALRLMRQYDLSYEQLYWREWAIDSKCRGSVDIFHENYPSNVEEAFLSTGLNVYGKNLCDDLEENCMLPALSGDIVERAGKPKIKPRIHGKMALWKKPDKHDTYFMTVDSGGGKKESQEDENREPDPTCIDVWQQRTGEQVAQWHGHIDYDMIGDIAELIGWLYYTETGKRTFKPAIACVELNNHGYTVVADLNRKRYPMYCYKPNEPGWYTTAKTKPLMVDGLYRATRDGALQIRCKQTISEMRTYVEKDGKYGAASGCHDERVVSGGMASQMLILLPLPTQKGKYRRASRVLNWEDKIRGEDQYQGEYEEVTIKI